MGTLGVGLAEASGKELRRSLLALPKEFRAPKRACVVWCRVGFSVTVPGAFRRRYRQEGKGGSGRAGPDRLHLAIFGPFFFSLAGENLREGRCDKLKTPLPPFEFAPSIHILLLLSQHPSKLQFQSPQLLNTMSPPIASGREKESNLARLLGSGTLLSYLLLNSWFPVMAIATSENSIILSFGQFSLTATQQALLVFLSWPSSTLYDPSLEPLHRRLP